MSLENGKQRFTSAVRCLADEQGPIKERHIGELGGTNYLASRYLLSTGSPC